MVALPLGACGSTTEHHDAPPAPSAASAVNAVDEPPRLPDSVTPPVVLAPTSSAEPIPVEGAGETLEALRIGGQVFLREPWLPWMTLTATHARTSSALRVTLRYEVDPFGPRDTMGVRWIEPRGAWTDADFVGTWGRSGSIPSPDGAIGWRQQYALREDGTYVFSAYPQLSDDGTWRRAADPTPQVTLLSANVLEAVGLVRDPAFEPSAPGPLRHVSVRVSQSDAPPPSDTPTPGPIHDRRTDPPAFLPARPDAAPRELMTDAEGVLTLALEPETTTVILSVGRHHVTLRP